MSNTDFEVNVIGLGYIGLPTALLVADSGIRVFGYDIDETKLQCLKKGETYFEEPGLDNLLSSVSHKKTFLPVNKLSKANVHIIAVPTPTSVGKADLTYVMSALVMVKTVAKKGDLIILESTVGPKDCIDEIIPEIKSWEEDCLFALCTERAIPGNTLNEMVHNDRVVGGYTKEASDIAVELYSNFVQGEVFVTDPTTAAVCKVMENTYRAVNIALANEFAKLATDYNFNVWEAVELTNKHPRVNIHQPGPGVGGHCIPIDPYFLIKGTDKSSLIKQGMRVNEGMPKYVVDKLDLLVEKHNLNNVTVGVLGYAYKKNVDDARDTPAEQIVSLLKDKYEVLVSDPYVRAENVISDTETVISKSQALILVTDHNEYQQIDFSRFPNVSFIIDTRNHLIDSKTLGDIVLYTLGKDI